MWIIEITYQLSVHLPLSDGLAKQAKTRECIGYTYRDPLHTVYIDSYTSLIFQTHVDVSVYEYKD